MAEPQFSKEDQVLVLAAQCVALERYKAGQAVTRLMPLMLEKVPLAERGHPLVRDLAQAVEHLNRRCVWRGSDCTQIDSMALLRLEGCLCKIAEARLVSAMARAAPEVAS